MLEKAYISGKINTTRKEFIDMINRSINMNIKGFKIC